MQYGICLLSIVAGRKEPSNQSEMITQLLFGEHYTVIEKNDGWAKIILAFDSYECWINIKQHANISESTFDQLQKQTKIYSNELAHSLNNTVTQNNTLISLGASLPFYKDKILQIESNIFKFEGQFSIQNIKKQSNDILKTANLLINTPYLWGGKSPFGIDCSGFTQLCFMLNGFKLPRDAYQQVLLGKTLDFVEESAPGDLAFFDNEEGKIIHVGILLNNQSIIHASGAVKIDKIDHYGIFNSDTKKYSHTLRIIKRLL